MEDGGGSCQRLRSALDDDDSDPAVSYIERDRLTTPGGLYLPPLFVTPAARRSAAPRTAGETTGDDVTTGRTTTCCRQPPTCLSRWWSGMFGRRRRDVARHHHRDNDDDDDDCWRLFPSRHGMMSRDAGARSSAAPGVGSLSSSPLGADDVGSRGTSHGGDVVLLTPPPRRCRRAAAADKSSAVASRQRCTRVVCVLVAGLCVGVVGLLLGALVIASPAASLHYSQSHSYSSRYVTLLMSLIIFTFVHAAR